MILISYIGLFADGVQPDGLGTEADPYQVASLDNLLWISTNNNSWIESTYFIQTADIDATDTENWNNEEGFSPIGNSNNNFYGNYNGQYYTIDGLYINRSTSHRQGMFGYTNGSTIVNIGLTNVAINGNYFVGALVGINNDHSIISNCFSTGNVSGDSNVGSLVGQNVNHCTISNCYSTGNVSSNFYYAGGLVGYNHSSTVSNCYSEGNVGGYNLVGGLIGYINYSSTVSNCYSIGNVSGDGTVGGLIGDNVNSTISNSFWDIETSGQTTSDGGTGKTTSEMKDVSTYTDLSSIGLSTAWDFFGNPNDDTGVEDYWNIDGIRINEGYPYLSWQSPPLIANFSADQTSATLGTEIQFTDESTENPTTWEWDFDNNGTIDSIEQNPVYTYNDMGTYTVSLTISDGTRSDTETKTDYITIENYGLLPLGTGTEEDPYQIATLDNLLWISTNNSSWSANTYFIQTADIDASDTENWNEGDGFSPIGIGTWGNRFSGNYDGQNYTIDSIYINRSTSDYQGLFGYVIGAIIDNLGVTNVDVNGDYNVGGLVGDIVSNSTIINCYSTGNANGYIYAGGLVAHNTSSTIISCYSTGSVSSDYSQAGGLVGEVYGNPITSNSFWDFETSGQTTSNGGAGKPTSEMQNIATFTDESTIGLDDAWDFIGNPNDDIGTEDFWDIDGINNDGYPYLSWQQNANFSASTTSASLGEAIQFSDFSIGNITNWDWDFNYDGTIDSNDQNPFFIYPVSGIYTVSLTVSDEFGEIDTEIKINYITVNNNGTQPDGAGTSGNPYQISSLANLLWLSDNISSWDKHYIQTADIDASSTSSWNGGDGFSPIGVSYSNRFTGIYNGMGYTIIGLDIDRLYTHNIGLFGYASGTISNLGIEDVYIKGDDCVGGLVGRSLSATIENCYSTGTVKGRDYQANSTGGLVGRAESDTNIDNCYSFCTILGVSDLGGLVGTNDHSNIINSCALGSVLGSWHFAGGIVGSNQNNSTINNCYSASVVSVPGNIGGLAASNLSSNIYNSFWDIETSGQTTSEGGTGKTTAEMKDIATFTDLTTVGLDIPWDFFGNPNDDTGNNDYWNIDGVNNDGYPYLSWQYSPPSAEIPTNVIIIVNGNNVELSWDEVGAKSYNIYRSSNPYAEDWGDAIGSSDVNSYTDEGAASETKYFYLITSEN
ncbi:MAG: PKD domain-containing protein [Candidatus Cloacimonetes bacterium]|nr:PKD domain-containing protein [Candidatus Cloacimonadota bacterium]